MKIVNRGGRLIYNSAKIREELQNDFDSDFGEADRDPIRLHVESFMDWSIVRRVSEKPNPTAQEADFTRAKVFMYLLNLSKTGLILRSATKSRIPFRHLVLWRDKWEAFRQAEQLAKELYTEICEAELHRRGVVGVREAIVGGEHHDEIIGYQRKYSDTCLKMILTGNKRDKYAPNANTQKVDVNVLSGVMAIPNQVVDEHTSPLPVEDVGDDDGT